ncbi:uncharacterized protein LOC121407553 [Lytechinus variegatus]|uniref:uncharacterized protein LOC121407553 n=1 Tax=Lytechinus variegatus TaxID=7654 RepID=UPI001BB0DEEF|nr:uncharacterized protein LOC121407553 [Lytechinus variegatus]
MSSEEHTGGDKSKTSPESFAADETKSGNGEKDPGESPVRTALLLDSQPVRQTDADMDGAQCSTQTLTRKSELKPLLPIDRVPMNAIVTDVGLLHVSSTVGNDSKLINLGIYLGFTYQEVREYKQTNYTGGEVGHQGTTKMLFDWKMKHTGYIRDLYAALEKSELVAVAEAVLLQEEGSYTYLEVPLSGSEDPFITMFKEELTQYYLDDYCCVKTDPWDEREFKLNQYFINMALCQENTSTGKVTKIPLKGGHNDLFDLKVDERLRNRILVFGEGGMGKTTLCKKLAYDWATKKEQSPLRNIPIVCALEFQKLQESDNVADAIHNQLLCKDSDITPKKIRQFIKANPEKIAIVLDGYDEFDPGSHKGDINDLLSCKIMYQVITLITTRPWHACLLRQKTHMYAQVSLDGFDADGIKAYVSQYFEDEPVANRCYESILANGIMLQLSRTPILLSMICYLKKVCSEDIDHLDTLNSLFAKFLRALFVNNIDRVGETQRPLYHEMVTEVIDMAKLEEFWDNLGEIALRGVLVPGKKLMFSMEVFQGREYICEVGLKLGILVRQKLKVTQDNVFESMKIVYSFPHLLFQEKCAGDFLAAHPDVLDSTLQGVDGVGEAISLQYALAFTCGRRPREEYCQSRLRSKKIIKRLSEMQDISGDTTSFLSETQHLGNIIPDILDDMLAIKSYHFARSLFLLSIVLNHESQAGSELLEEITSLDKDRPVHSPDQDYDGRLCDCLLYFLKSASLNNCLLQPCGSLTLTNSINKIPLFDFLSMAMKVFTELRNVSMMKYSADFSLPRGYTDDGNSSSKKTMLQELHLSYGLEPVNLSDLLNLMVGLDFDALALSISNCQMDMISHASEISQSMNPGFRQYNGIRKIELTSIETPVEMTYLLETAARFCPMLMDLNLNFMALNMPTYASLEDWPIDFLGKTSLKRLNIGYTDNPIQAIDLIKVLSLYCTCLKRCYLTDVEVEIPSPMDIEFVDFAEKLAVEEFELNNLHSTVNFADIMCLVGKTCSGVKLISLNRFKLSIPNLVEIRRIGLFENPELEDIRIRMTKSASTTPLSGQGGESTGNVSDSPKDQSSAGASAKKFDSPDDEIKTGVKTDKRDSLSIPSITCQSNTMARDFADERRLSSFDNRTHIPLKTSSKLSTNVISTSRTISKPMDVSCDTPNLHQHTHSATENRVQVNTSQVHGNVIPNANEIKRLLKHFSPYVMPESGPLPTTDREVSLIFLNKNIPQNWFSLLDLLALTATTSSNLKRLRLLDVNVEIPSLSLLKSYPFRVGIKHLIMAKTRFRNASLVQVLNVVAAVCPNLQLLGLSDWLEDIGPNINVDYESPCNLNLTEIRVEFLHNSVSLHGMLSLTSAICPSLRILSIANIKGSMSTPSEESTQSRKCHTPPPRFQLSLIRCWSPISIPELLSLMRRFYQVAILKVALWDCQLAVPPERSDYSWYSERHQYQVHLTKCRARLVGMTVQNTMSKTCPFFARVVNDDDKDEPLKYQTPGQTNLFDEASFFDDRRRLMHYAFLQHEIDAIESPNSPRDVY